MALIEGFTVLIIKKQIISSINKHLDPVIQSIVSLTSSLRGQHIKCFLLTFFQQKYWHI